MNYAQTIYQRSLTLPEAAAREALDFIEFLARRYGSPTTSSEWVQPPHAAPSTEYFLAAIAGGLSADFPDDIPESSPTMDVPRDAF
ncbi:DUF2281 domain-containing protein [Leptothrix ochracea]|uniref:DUF2281 domain-containing protein n=1 Tax=Leptothrix ochracea TaxID=735331 RepID=UPI0034E1B6EE